MASIRKRQKQTEYGGMTAYSENMIEYISNENQYYLSSMDNIFSAICSSGVIILVLGCELDFSLFQILQI